MKQYISNKWKEWNTTGIRFPFAHDPTENKPSITLFFPYLAGYISLASIIALHFYSSILVATSISILFFVITMVFYRMRKLDKVKIDIDNKSIDLESENEK